jgi:YVTN family beta-propeller protein
MTVIDGASKNATTVATGAGPAAVAVNTVTNKIYVANFGSGSGNTVTVVDGATNNTTSVTVGTGPCAVGINPNTNQIYVANYYSNTVTVIDGATNNTTTLAVGTSPSAVAMNPTTNSVYVENYGSNNVTVINGATNTTTTTLTSNPNPSTQNASVTFTATVGTSGANVPTGTVIFMDGSITLGTTSLNGSGVATYSTSTLTASQHSITAVYGGDANDAGSTSAVFTRTVNAADFALSSAPTGATVAAGGSTAFTVTVTPQGSFTTAITFSCSGLPSMAVCGFNPTSLTPNASNLDTTLTITTAAQSSRGELLPAQPSGRLYVMGLVLPAMLLGTVGLAAPKRRKLLSFALVCVLVGGCPLQTACGGGNSGGGGSTGTPSGTYTITVTGTAGSTVHSTTVTITIQ